MKLFGSLKELVSAVYRKDSQEITLRPNQSTTYTANRDIQLPPGDAAHVLSSASSTQTLTNKTIDGDDNTVQDLPVTAIKTVLGDADKVILRDASGVPTSALLVNANVSASAAIAYSKLSIADGDLTIAKTNGLQSALDGKVSENAPITGATKTKITYDAKGLVTAGADIAASDLPTGIDAAKIADGSVSNTEFQKLGTAGNTGLGELVTTDGVQRLIVKDIDGETASDDSRITLPKETTAGLAALTRKEATLAYDTTLAKVVVDDGSGFAVVGGGGGGSESVHTVTSADYTILDNDGYTLILVSTGASNRTITLPTLAANQARAIKVKKIDSGAGYVILDGEGSETIDGDANKRLVNQYEEIQVIGTSSEWAALTRYFPLASEVVLDGANGMGSTNTKIKRFLITRKNVGNAITYADSSTAGASFTINQKGIYSVSYNDSYTVSFSQFGLTRNSTQLTTNISSVAAADVLIWDNNTIGDSVGAIAWTGELDVGDVIRPHTSGNSTSALPDQYWKFTITQVRPV